MKKTIILSLMAVLVSILGIGQSKTVTMDETKIGPLTCKHQSKIDLSTGDSLNYLIVLFRNAKYKSLVDIESVIMEESDIPYFLADMSLAAKEMSLGSNINWDRDRYGIHVYDFTNLAYLSDKYNRAYTELNSREVQKLVDWLRELDISQ